MYCIVPINQFVVLKFESQSIANYSIRKVMIPMIENDLKFVSYHSSVYFDNKVYILCGYSQCIPTIDNQAPLLNNKCTSVTWATKSTRLLMYRHHMSRQDTPLAFSACQMTALCRLVASWIPCFCIPQNEGGFASAKMLKSFWTSRSKSRILQVMPVQIMKYALIFQILCQSEWNYTSQNRLTCYFQAK